MFPPLRATLPAEYMDAADKGLATFLKAYCMKGKVKLTVALARSSLSSRPGDAELNNKRSQTGCRSKSSSRTRIRSAKSAPNRSACEQHLVAARLLRMTRPIPHVARLTAAALLLMLAAVSTHAQDWAKARLDASPRHHEYVTLKHDNRSLQAFVVYPEVKNKATVVVLIHEIFGLSDWAKEMADELAATGLHRGRAGSDFGARAQWRRFQTRCPIGMRP